MAFDNTKILALFLDSIQALLSAPNPDDPLSENIAKHWKTNEAEAVETGNVVSLHFYWFLQK
jgi:ubiquitin-protein ligase